MMKSKPMRMKLLLAVLSALAFIVAGPDPPSFANYRDRCKPLRFLKHATPLFNESEGFLNVPIVVHYMYNPDLAADYKGLFPWDLVPPKDVADMFLPADPDVPEITLGSVNEIWKKAGVHFVLKRLEKCGYSQLDYPFRDIACEYACEMLKQMCMNVVCYGQCPPPPDPSKRPDCSKCAIGPCLRESQKLFSDRLHNAGTLEDATIPNPAPRVKMGFFRWINAHYNATHYCAHRRELDRQCTTTLKRRGIDIYVWWHMQKYMAGFSVSDLDDTEPVAPKQDPQDPPGPGAVWISGYKLVTEQYLPGGGVRLVLDRVQAARLLAHELGHFLGLCHACAGKNASSCVNKVPPHPELRVECGARSDYIQRDSFFLAGTPRDPCQDGDEERLMYPDTERLKKVVKLTAMEMWQAYRRAIPYARAPANHALRTTAAAEWADRPQMFGTVDMGW